MQNKQSKLRLLVSGGVLALLVASSVALGGGGSDSGSQASLLAVKAVKKEASAKKNEKKKINKKKGTKKNGKKKKTAGKFKPTKRNCALAARWAAEGTYTENVLSRGWPYTADLNDDGVEEHVVETACNRAGYPVSF